MATGNGISPLHRLAGRGSCSDGGFTLIEMLVTIGVAGLVAGLIFPGIDRMQDYWRFRAAISSVNGGLATARADAIRQGEAVSVSLSADGRQALRADQRIWSLPDGIFAQAGTATILFYPDGTAIDVRVTISDQASRRSQIDIDGTTGRVGPVS